MAGINCHSLIIPSHYALRRSWYYPAGIIGTSLSPNRARICTGWCGGSYHCLFCG